MTTDRDALRESNAARAVRVFGGSDRAAEQAADRASNDTFQWLVSMYESMDSRSLRPSEKRARARRAVLAEYGSEQAVRDLFAPPNQGDRASRVQGYRDAGLSEAAAKVAAIRPAGRGSGEMGLSESARKILETRPAGVVGPSRTTSTPTTAAVTGRHGPFGDDQYAAMREAAREAGIQDDYLALLKDVRERWVGGADFTEALEAAVKHLTGGSATTHKATETAEAIRLRESNDERARNLFDHRH